MSVRLIQDLHAGISRRDWHAVEMAANRLRDDIEKTVAILAGTGVSSLPNDYPLSKLATDALTPAPQPNVAGWQDMSTAPKDGTQIIWRTTQEQVFACNWFWDDEEETEETEGDWLEHGTDVVSPREWLAMPAPEPQAEGEHRC